MVRTGRCRPPGVETEASALSELEKHIHHGTIFLSSASRRGVRKPELRIVGSQEPPSTTTTLKPPKQDGRTASPVASDVRVYLRVRIESTRNSVYALWLIRGMRSRFGIHDDVAFLPALRPGTTTKRVAGLMVYEYTAKNAGASSSTARNGVCLSTLRACLEG